MIVKDSHSISYFGVFKSQNSVQTLSPYGLSLPFYISITIEW